MLKMHRPLLVASNHSEYSELVSCLITVSHKQFQKLEHRNEAQSTCQSWFHTMASTQQSISSKMTSVPRESLRTTQLYIGIVYHEWWSTQGSKFCSSDVCVCVGGGRGVRREMQSWPLWLQSHLNVSSAGGDVVEKRCWCSGLCPVLPPPCC